MSINEESPADATGIAEDGKQHGGRVINGCLYFSYLVFWPVSQYYHS